MCPSSSRWFDHKLLADRPRPRGRGSARETVSDRRRPNGLMPPPVTWSLPIRERHRARVESTIVARDLNKWSFGVPLDSRHSSVGPLVHRPRQDTDAYKFLRKAGSAVSLVSLVSLVLAPTRSGAFGTKTRWRDPSCQVCPQGSGVNLSPLLKFGRRACKREDVRLAACQGVLGSNQQIGILREREREREHIEVQEV